MSAPVLEVDSLSIDVERDGRLVRIVDELSFTLDTSEVVGLAGESGSGKSMVARALLALLPRGARVVRGSIRLEGRELVGLKDRALRGLRGARIAMIFQEPMTALNPVITVGEQILEVAHAHGRARGAKARRLVLDMMARVRFSDPERVFVSYPHQLSGGMRQRALIAMALLLDPAVLVADEPTTLLDVTVESEIVALLGELAQTRGVAILFVSHDLALLGDIASRILVMYAGQLVEDSPTAQLLQHPSHPYSAALLRALPSRVPRGERLPVIPGVVPDLAAPPPGCRFSERCPTADPRCTKDAPRFEALSSMRRARCFFPLSSSELRR